MSNEFSELATGEHQESNKPSFPPYSSPTSAVSAEETRILTEYIQQKNLFHVIRRDESRRKTLLLKQFFKMKRHQQVSIISAVNQNETITTVGKVATIGRDFVMVTDLKKRTWIPYEAIDSATIPFGFPTYSTPHQHHIYDNQLQQKLVLRFGETVAAKDALVRQFFEETLHTNLSTWNGVWVEVDTVECSFFGKLKGASKTECVLQRMSSEHRIPLSEIRSITTIGPVSLWKRFGKQVVTACSERIKGWRA
ncbi:hypothetical protein M3152_02775 [Sporosarcina luteola]|uniref:hypothetical protein n=1 Tax=Bacillales TaxID=1385 RepID=UPI00203AF932|nr:MULTISPECIES: hypothetical protein [Bacillales]MCM3636631.1 hypothetical protein [Sporosarcina luteola]